LGKNSAGTVTGNFVLDYSLRATREVVRETLGEPGEKKMAGSRLSPFVACLAAGSLFVSSTGAVAATASRPVVAPAVHQINPWAALTALTGGAPTAALCGAAAVAAAAQPAAGCVLPAVDAPPVVAQQGPPPPTPVPPVEPVGGGLGIDPLYLGLGALVIGALVYFLLIKKDKDHDNDVSPT
jgi:hypothetical protein